MGIGHLIGLIELHASSNSLKGSFPEEILQLTYLERLTLSFNSFIGTLPNDIGSELKRMKVLSLDHNFLTGSLPRGFSSYQLQSLDLSGNSFSGTVPDDLLSSSIEASKFSLDLSSNLLTGELPGSLSRFPMSNLDFSDNKLTSISGKVYYSSSFYCNRGIVFTFFILHLQLIYAEMIVP